MSKINRQEKDSAKGQKKDKRSVKDDYTSHVKKNGKSLNSTNKQQRSLLKLVKGSLGSAFRGHKSDLISLGLILIGIVAALGLYFGTAGAVGKALGPWLFRALFGYIGYIAPVALLAGGLYLVFESPIAKSITDDKDEYVSRTAPILTGALLLFVAICGITHLNTDASSSNLSNLSELKNGGGILGYLIGTPLRAAFEQVGAVFVLLAIGLLGTILVTGLTFRDALTRAWLLTKKIATKVVNSIRLAMGETRDEIAQRTGTPENPTIQIDGETRRLNDGKKGKKGEKAKSKEDPEGLSKESKIENKERN